MTTWNKQATPEGLIKNQVRQYLRYNSWFVFHVQGGPLSYPGVSDFIAVKCGKVAFIEVKRAEGASRTGRKLAEGKLSKEQERFRDDVVARGGEFFVVRSLEDVQAMERKLGL